jgi:sigma-B regulation protein RsbU (phosphoserine phosphatase)
VLSLLNRRLLVRGVPRRYSAAQYAVFDPQTRKMCIAAAGIAGPLHVSSRGCRILEIPGVPPGLFGDVEYDTSTISLEPGDSVIFYTDGITDAFSLEDESFGILRVQKICEREAQAEPAELLRRVFTALESFTRGREQYDDMTAAVFRYEGCP